MWLLLLLLLAAARASWLEEAGASLMGFHHGAYCTYSRGDALRCIARHVDANHDGEVSAAEFERAKRLYLPPQLRAAEWVLKRLGYYISIRDVMHGCDANGDGHLTLADWKASAATCLPHQADLCKLKTVCERAQAEPKSPRTQ